MLTGIFLQGAVSEPKRPFAAIVGGSKVRAFPIAGSAAFAPRFIFSIPVIATLLHIGADSTAETECPAAAARRCPPRSA